MSSGASTTRFARDAAWQNASHRDARPSRGASSTVGGLFRMSDRDTTLGVHVADLETPCLTIGDRVDFTLYWPEAQRWEGADFVVCGTSVGQFNDGRSIHRNFGTGSRKGCGRGSRSPSCRAR